MAGLLGFTIIHVRFRRDAMKLFPMNECGSKPIQCAKISTSRATVEYLTGIIDRGNGIA